MQQYLVFINSEKYVTPYPPELIQNKLRRFNILEHSTTTTGFSVLTEKRGVINCKVYRLHKTTVEYVSQKVVKMLLKKYAKDYQRFTSVTQLAGILGPDFINALDQRYFSRIQNITPLSKYWKGIKYLAKLANIHIGHDRYYVSHRKDIYYYEW